MWRFFVLSALMLVVAVGCDGGNGGCDYEVSIVWVAPALTELKGLTEYRGPEAQWGSDGILQL